jgi:hypothetical protein
MDGMTERDLVRKRLQELYDFNRGALYSNSLMQAQAAFEHGDFVSTLELVRASRGLFEKRHKHTLDQDPAGADAKRKASRQERRALEGKQARIREILGIFDEVLSPLETMAKLQRLGRPRPAVEAGPAGGVQSAGQPPRGFEVAYEAAQTIDARHQVICRYFHLEPIGSDQDITPDTLYYVRGKESHLTRSTPGEPGADPVPMTVVPSGQPMKPVPRQRLLELGGKGQLLKLVPKAPLGAAFASRSARGAPDSAADGSTAPTGVQKSYTECLIDLGSFTQLLTSAQQSEIVPNADQIAHVRDREFRTGRYQAAFDAIERLFVKFNLLAAQREQKLRREEIDYKSGVLKMSPKQWQLKKQRDRLQTQKIERARRHFIRVLDGLRVLMASP